MNALGLKDQIKAARLLRHLLTFGIVVAAIQETHFIWEVDARVLPSNFVVYSVYGNRLAKCVSLVDKGTFDANVELVRVNAEGRLVVVYIAVNNSSFRIVAFYTPNDQTERVSFFCRSGLFLVDSPCLVFMGDRNAILDPKIYRGWGASGRSWDRNMVELIVDFGLVDRYRVDNPEREM